jgi:hypothetical protein
VSTLFVEASDRGSNPCQACECFGHAFIVDLVWLSP